MESLREDTASLRAYPYPYKSMLAISSDLDETPDADTYFEICRFLNTNEETVIGRGVGLEVGNTIYFDMPEGQMSYWNATDHSRQRIRELIRSGHIDCFHSFGDLADSREKIKRSLDELESHGCKLRVWIDHAVAPSNFGTDIMHGSGDDPESEVFHADLTVLHGVEYVWIGRVTSVFGQNVAKSYRGIFSSGLPISSFGTVLKEIVKGVLSRREGSKYRLHQGNFLMKELRLRSGHRVQQFIRCNPHASGVSAGDRGDQFFEAISSAALDRLIACKGVSIVYTHLGKTGGCPTIFPERTVTAFRDLASRSRKGDILVTTTARLLDQVRRQVDLSWSFRMNGEYFDIEVVTDGPIPEGLSFNYRSDSPVRLIINGEARNDVTIQELPNGEAVVFLPWKFLVYPPLRQGLALGRE